jgi:hypothetical protein
MGGAVDVFAGAPPCPPLPDHKAFAEREAAYSESLFKLRCALDKLGVVEAKFKALEEAADKEAADKASQGASLLSP